MIKSFRDKPDGGALGGSQDEVSTSRRILSTRPRRKTKAVSPHLVEKAVSKLTAIDMATSVKELRAPPGNRLHKLGGDWVGQWSVSIDKQYRICFRFSEAGDAHDVEVTDYH